MQQDLTVGQMAKIADCHRNTVLNYQARGLIRASRDINGRRRFLPEEAAILRALLSVRRPSR